MRVARIDRCAFFSSLRRTWVEPRDLRCRRPRSRKPYASPGCHTEANHFADPTGDRNTLRDRGGCRRSSRSAASTTIRPRWQSSSGSGRCWTLMSSGFCRSGRISSSSTRARPISGRNSNARNPDLRLQPCGTCGRHLNDQGNRQSASATRRVAIQLAETIDRGSAAVRRRVAGPANPHADRLRTRSVFAARHLCERRYRVHSRHARRRRWRQHIRGREAAGRPGDLGADPRSPPRNHHRAALFGDHGGRSPPRARLLEHACRSPGGANAAPVPASRISE